MSFDYSSGAKPPTRKDPLFLHMIGGMTVFVFEGEDWWMGDVIFREGEAKDPKVLTLSQIACVHMGVIRWFNSALVTHVVPAT